MRIKINDKIYRLKEIESGVDSLMELVEESQYKDGDFVVNEAGSILIFRKKDEDRIYDHALFNNVSGLSITQLIPSGSPIMRHATEEEKQKLLDALEKEGKRWNAEKLCVEDIPEKPKRGDLAIFWDSNKGSAMIGKYDYFIGDFTFPHRDHRGDVWKNAIKFESKEQFEKLIRGEI
jgi:MoaA/NifB/PqqE/SkfB family radical SAM enzyme